MFKQILILLLASTLLMSCIEPDDSFIITDDAGNQHKTPNFLKDKWGRDVFPEKIDTEGQKTFYFDPKKSAWAAYDEQGYRLMTGSGSGGMDHCQDIDKPCRTISGTFKVYHKKGEDCHSGEYPIDTNGGAKMPYCMYFYRGFTIHAAFEVPHYASSHGCIRVWPSAAKWLNESFMTLGTKVIVLSYADDSSAPAA